MRKMTRNQCEDFIREMREKYAAGELPEWQIKRLNQIEGWTWTEPIGRTMDKAV